MGETIADLVDSRGNGIEIVLKDGTILVIVQHEVFRFGLDKPGHVQALRDLRDRIDSILSSVQD
jgi:hypothetical protein